ncbi:penicillin-binding protein 1B [Microbulbifer sp. MKSA007]|nr:penicillin-binding protein 1B [Microbulbifer sp. MKSA007]
MASTKRRRVRASKPKRRYRWLKLLVLLALVGSLALAAYMAYLDVQLRERLDSRQYQLPARVYARPLVLREGMAMHPDELESEFAALNYRKQGTLSEPGSWVQDGMNYKVWRRDFIHANGRQPAAVVSFRLRNDQISGLRDDNGRSLAEFRLDAANIGSLLGGGDDRNPVRFDDIPPLVANTLIAVEDQDFLNHFGVSPRGIARAMVANAKAGRLVQGGSTITQQLVKNIFFDHKPSLRRKFNEALMAILMEVHYDKRYILQEYINEVWLGQQGARGIYGFGLASEFYFQQPLDTLEPHQVALLVGLAKGASYYNPWRNPERALQRRNTVLELMLEQGLITQEEFQKYSAKPLGVVKGGVGAQNPYPAFTERLLIELRPYYSYEELRTSGLRVYTTLAPSVQKLAEESISQGVSQLEKDRGIKANSLQAATVLLDNRNGNVLAMVGDRNPDYPGFNRALEARRQVGSLIKPAVFLTALERPEEYNLATLIDDAPVRIEEADGDVWMPQNFDKRAHGQIPLYIALAKSYNLATAHLGLDLGLQNVRQTIRRLGVESRLPRVPAMLLGAVEMTPFEVAGMYQTIANNGETVQPRTLLAVSDAQGGRVQHFRRKANRGVDPVPAYLLRWGLEQAMREGTGRRSAKRLPSSIAFAGKTGTTNNNRDSWFAGFSPEVTAVVWLGRDDNERTRLTGSTGALPIWTEIMRKLPHQHGPAEMPRGVELKSVNSRGQFMDPDYCRGGYEIPFSYESQLQPAPECRGQNRWRWFRNLFGNGRDEAAPREEMSPGWGVDTSEQQMRDQRRQQLQEQLRGDDAEEFGVDPEYGSDYEEEPLELPRDNTFGGRAHSVPAEEAQPVGPDLEDQWP